MKRENNAVHGKLLRLTCSLVALSFLGLLTDWGKDEANGEGIRPPQWPETKIVYKVHGIDFSPYMDKQDPNWGYPISEEQLAARMRIVPPYTQWIRMFGCTNGLEKAGAVVHSLGRKAAMGAWIGGNLSANEQEISSLLTAAQTGQADMAIVGSEVLLRGDLTEDQLIDYINRVKKGVPAGIPVTTADVYGVLLSHPKVLSAVDVVLVNYYPYWEGVRVDKAIGQIHRGRRTDPKPRGLVAGVVPRKEKGRDSV